MILVLSSRRVGSAHCFLASLRFCVHYCINCDTVHTQKTRFARFFCCTVHDKDPNIQEHQTVDILRGLPEGSRLSPTLFEILVAELIHELQTQFPHAVINLAPGLQHKGTTQIWIGGLLYVDDLALMSTCPRELQAMLHVCQEWSVRNRMQISTQKTKVMAFFETPSLHKARDGKR